MRSLRSGRGSRKARSVSASGRSRSVETRGSPPTNARRPGPSPSSSSSESLGQVDIDRFLLQIVLDAVLAQLPAHSRLFVASPRHLRWGGLRVVDVDVVLELVCHLGPHLPSGLNDCSAYRERRLGRARAVPLTVGPRWLPIEQL